MRFLLLALLASSACSDPAVEPAAASAREPAVALQEELIDFESVPAGEIPEGWRIEATHAAAELAKWTVAEDPEAPSGEKVLSVDVGEFNGGTFNLCWTDQITFQDGSIEIRVKAGKGRVDQGGGPIWRVRDKDNYYIARWNPLEDNFRLYYVKEGRRVQLASAGVEAAPDRWHTIRIEQQGDHILCFLDGQELLEARDRTFSQAGGVGLWTKADASSRFDDLKIGK